jgi:hypothetical protein
MYNISMDENLDLSENIEINEALKEFEAKNIGQPQSVQETTSVLTAQKNYKAPETSRMAQWVMKISGGVIKEEQQAEYVLLGFALIVIIVSLFLVFGGVNQQNKININPETGREIVPGQVPGGI